MYQSLVRPHLVMGADRTAMLYNAAFAMGVYFLTMSVAGIIVSISLFAVVQAVLVRLARSDTDMIPVVTRARKYQTFYGDGSGLDAEYRDIPMPRSIAPTTRFLSFLSAKGSKHAEHKRVS